MRFLERTTSLSSSALLGAELVIFRKDYLAEVVLVKNLEVFQKNSESLRFFKRTTKVWRKNFGVFAGDGQEFRFDS